MIRLLLLSFFFFLTLRADFWSVADSNETNNTIVELPKVLYLNFTKMPERIVRGEIFSVTIKTLSTVQEIEDVEYELSNFEGVEPLNYSLPYREIYPKYYDDTFYFLATKSKVKLPDFTATLIDGRENQYKKTTLSGNTINVITLNPKKDYANIIANSFELAEYRTTSYDKTHNIVVFVANAQNCNIKSFQLNNVYKQGIESSTESIFDSKITYYAVIDKKIQNFSFSYFNLIKNKFVKIDIPIIVDDDSVTTQTDLKPKDQSREMLKMSIAASVAFIALLFVLYRKKYIYAVFILIPLLYISYTLVPTKDICIKSGSNIRLLPVENGTIFETTQSVIRLEKEGSVKEFIKVKLQNQKIGWVKNEDICSN
ncbi:MAG: hypothetical protein GW906_03885 [Epsilonproteobacteria bacterium]|nr:hypothetical protein [Campylobacterota bacterium]OIO17154.1 MAG: hypothetical protein AUJ81_02695 [Helicobacteraceae bacterium CG1_02_36_14]PIP10125.1 MAG: hypothetical protein COX50_06515 [Sulfurimonas sp. CG23_combo_of_CG06-09_8_20_14_all_36_33]PIS26556.1 MAG: hypothetical protein COT46_02945 [Sulfurimonas sp. CG08_land_8_20_14_0_20_36_33]PIU34017.1 MAG: hypothetical protein COT05_10350 [Sulfurimonas sp. CG07_land_8_20_14_0_80_36_56]PIV03845.1 MAG: hypothetical protein COS56_07575 [Sulfur